jgi:hypothetical protein
LTNKIEIFWKTKKIKLCNLDWFKDENINVQGKIEETKEWLTGVKRTLHLGVFDKDKKLLRKAVEQRYPKRKNNNPSG